MTPYIHMPLNWVLSLLFIESLISYRKAAISDVFLWHTVMHSFLSKSGAILNAFSAHKLTRQFAVAPQFSAKFKREKSCVCVSSSTSATSAQMTERERESEHTYLGACVCILVYV